MKGGGAVEDEEQPVDDQFQERKVGDLIVQLVLGGKGEAVKQLVDVELAGRRRRELPGRDGFQRPRPRCDFRQNTPDVVHVFPQTFQAVFVAQ